MHNLLKALTAGMLTLGINLPLLANDSSTHPLVGDWVSNKEASINELSKAGLASEEIDKLSFLFGQMVVTIKDGTYTTMLNGEINQIPYSIISTTNNCYKLKLGQNIDELCVVNDMLHVPSYKGSKEVFNRKI